MATTTNFGWETPDDTDLVKDGAAAIRTALGGVDTSFVDLKGGTTGQVLAKASGTDLDFNWVAQDDSNAIQNAIMDAKGDLIAASAADTPARLAVGTNGQVLTADSTAATGIKWATPSATPTTSGVSCFLTADLSVPNGSTTTVDYTSEFFDTDAYHSTVTNPSRLTVPAGKAGYYWVFVRNTWDPSSATGSRVARVVANVSGTNITYEWSGAGNPVNQGNINVQYGFMIYLGVNDYVSNGAYQTSGGNLNLIKGQATTNFYNGSLFGMYLIGA